MKDAFVFIVIESCRQPLNSLTAASLITIRVINDYSNANLLNADFVFGGACVHSFIA